MSIASTIASMQTNLSNAYDKVNDKGGTLPANKNLQNLADAIDSISGGVSTEPQNIFTGATAPLTYLNSTNNVFEYKSDTHNITITGLNNVSIISGNGTKNVTVTINTTSSSDRQTAFTITCVKGNETLTYNGIEFHYGSTLQSGYCLAVAQSITSNQINYMFIESSSLPIFTSDTALWNNVYSHQIINIVLSNTITEIGNQFLNWCFAFNQPLTIPNSVTTIGDTGGFMYYCVSFNQPITLSNNLTTICNNFMQSCSAFNQPLTIPNSVTTIGTYFMYGCSAFNRQLTLSNSLTAINSSFLYYCYSFNQPITIPDSVTTIGTYFMGYCYAFNQALTLPSSLTEIGNYFLYYDYAFNQPLTIPNTLVTLGSYVLNYCYAFNQPITIPSSVTTFGTYFMRYCYAFNQPVIINCSVVGDNFMNQCRAFNQQITLSNETTIIGSTFMQYCMSFNQQIILPNTLTSIGSYFLNYCYAFNQPLTIPNSVTKLNSYFMAYCNSFNQPITIPSSITTVSTYFMYNCYCLLKVEYNASVYPTGNQSLSQDKNTKTSSSGTGIFISGTNASGLKNALANRTSSPFRKLVLA